MRMHTLVRQLLEDMNNAERQAFHTLLLMDMAGALYVKKEREYEDPVYFNLTSTLNTLFPNRKKSSGVYKRVVLFKRVVLKFEIIRDSYNKYGNNNVASEVSMWKRFAAKKGKLADRVYLAPTAAISKHISVQKRYDKRGTEKEACWLEDTVGWGNDGDGEIGDIHTGNFRKDGERLVIIDFANNYPSSKSWDGGSF